MTTTNNNNGNEARKLDLTTLVHELKNQNLRKNDLVVPSRSLRFENGQLIISNLSAEPNKLGDLLMGTGITTSNDAETKITFDNLPNFHAQTSDKLGIPKQYYDRMLNGNISLLDANVNSWLEKSKNNYLVRTFVDKDNNSGYARALLSDRYNIMDNYDVLLTCLEAIRESGMNVEIEYADVTETNMYVRFVCPDIELQAPELLKNYTVPKGSPNNGNPGIVSGFVISNSEVGKGTFRIAPRALILACRNGLIRKDESFNKVHLGGKLETNTSINWSEKTKNKNYELIMSQCQDAIKLFMSKDYLGNWIDTLCENGAKELQHPIDAIKNTSKYLNLTDKEESDILNYFIQGRQTTGFGISQAITYYAHQNADADRQYDMEMYGNDVLEQIAVLDKPFVEKRTRRQKAELN